jgi:hypothetical protein
MYDQQIAQQIEEELELPKACSSTVVASGEGVLLLFFQIRPPNTTILNSHRAINIDDSG